MFSHRSLLRVCSLLNTELDACILIKLVLKHNFFRTWFFKYLNKTLYLSSNNSKARVCKIKNSKTNTYLGKQDKLVRNIFVWVEILILQKYCILLFGKWTRLTTQWCLFKCQSRGCYSKGRRRACRCLWKSTWTTDEGPLVRHN